MLKDITLGQFFPGDTLAHKLDPRTKLLVTVFYVVALFTAKSYIAYGVLILTLIVAVRISRVGAKALFKGWSSDARPTFSPLLWCTWRSGVTSEIGRASCRERV